MIVTFVVVVARAYTVITPDIDCEMLPQPIFFSELSSGFVPVRHIIDLCAIAFVHYAVQS